MGWMVTKYLLSAAVVVLVSEAAKRSDKLGGFLAALALITLPSLTWLYLERQPTEKIASHAWYTFWYVLPTLPMFLVFPRLLPRLGFWPGVRGADGDLLRRAGARAAALRHRAAMKPGVARSAVCAPTS